jgi:phage/plasmid-like protein (TIGR03299 family)
MAHELTVNRITRQVEMAFAGELPWHGLGQRVDPKASVEVWQAQAGMAWSALTSPVTFTRSDGSRGTDADRCVIYRSDTGDALSVMGSGYKVVQPAQCLEFFRDLVGSGEWEIHTAGTLRGGRKLWAMARRADSQGDYIVPGDRVRANLLMATSLDGSTPTVAALTSVRVVCANTLGAALGALDSGRRVRGSHVRVTHRSIWDARAAKIDLGVAEDHWGRFIRTMRELAAQPIEFEQARSILREIFGQPVKRATSVASAANRVTSPFVASLIASAEREQKSVARCLDLFAGAGMGSTHAGVAGTRWGLLNAITQHVDHEQGRSADTRLDSAWFGRGAQFKARAVELLTA